MDAPGQYLKEKPQGRQIVILAYAQRRRMRRRDREKFILLELTWHGGQPYLGKGDLERVSKPVTKEENEMESNKTSFSQSTVLYVLIRMITSQ